MRFWGPAVVTGAFLFPFTLFAQHTAAPAPSHVAPTHITPIHVTPTISHVSSVPSAVSHVSSNPSSRTSGAASPTAARGSHTTPKNARDPKAATVKERELSKSVRNTRSEKRGSFSLLSKREPLQGDLRTKCKRGHCSTKDSVARNQSVSPAPADTAPSEAHLGCVVVALANPAVPCNVFSPCCP